LCRPPKPINMMNKAPTKKKLQAGLAGDEAKEPDQGKENEDPAANPGRLSFGKNPQNLASKAGKRCRKMAG
jgi:hypothetical protein